MSVLRFEPSPDRGRRATTACIAGILLFHLTGFSSLAHAKMSDCASVVEQSLRSYQEGRFDRAIAALDECLRNQGIEKERRGDAYRILGLCYIAKDDEDRARIAIHQLLLLEPQWQPDPLDDPPAFQRLVADVRTAMSEGRLVSPAETSTQSKGSKNWWILGSLVAAGGALAVVLLSGGGDDPDPDQGADLPEPPGLPED